MDLHYKRSVVFLVEISNKKAGICRLLLFVGVISQVYLFLVGLSFCGVSGIMGVLYVE